MIASGTSMPAILFLGLVVAADIGSRMFAPAPCDCEAAVGSLDRRLSDLELIVTQYTSKEEEEKEEKEKDSEGLHATLLDGGGNRTYRTPRQLQRSGDDGAPRTVHIFSAMLTAQRMTGTARPSRGRRRVQVTRACDATLIESRSEDVRMECCNEPQEDCSTGMPSVCNSGCAAVVLQFWHDCESELGKDKDLHSTVHEVVRQCQDADVVRAGFSDAQLLQLTCTDGRATETCVPECDETLHGDLLLANIDGEDSKYSCELHHSLYSWMGSGSDGGYLGRDAVAFLSSLLSGAAGAYRLIVTEDAEINTDVQIEPGMDVHIAGAIGLGEEEIPTWGSGSFTVGERARLSLARLRLDLEATIVAVAGADIFLAEMSLRPGQLDWSQTTGSTLSLSDVSFAAPSVETGDPCNGGRTITPVGPGGSGIINWWFPVGQRTPARNGHEGCVDDGRQQHWRHPLCDACSSMTHGAAAAQAAIQQVDQPQCQPLCTWNIECPGATVEFVDFDTEGMYDFVRVGDSPWLSGELTAEGIGSTHLSNEYTASPLVGSVTTISFTADDNAGGQGFRALYHCPGGDTLSQSYTVGHDSHSLTNATAGALDWQCYEPSAAMRTEAWRDVAEMDTRSLFDIPELPFSEGKLYCDTTADIGSENLLTRRYGPEALVYDHNSVIGTQWIRLAGDGGDSIATRPPRESLTPGASTMWMSSWNPDDGAPSNSEAGHGSLPRQQDGIQRVTMCGTWVHPCDFHAFADVVNCGDHYLWRLPRLEQCPAFYATQPSGLRGANDVATVGTDCVGHWSECTKACEPAADRSFILYAPATGYGLPCPPASDCQAGDGACGLSTDCDGRWSECTLACEPAAERTWIEFVAPSGMGTPCPPSTDCQIGDGACGYQHSNGH